MVSGACSRAAESMKVDKKLQAMTGARISKNGNYNDDRAKSHHPVEAYPAMEHRRASSSSAAERKNGDLRGAQGVLCPGDDGIGGGVKWRWFRSGQRTRRIDGVSIAVLCASERHDRVALGSCPRLTKALTSWARLVSETDDVCAAELSGSRRTVGFKLDGSDLVGGSDCPKGSRDLGH